MTGNVRFPLCQGADIDERAIRREEPEQLVKTLAEAKVRTSKRTVMLFLLVFFSWMAYRSYVFLELQAEAIKLKLQGDSAPDSDQPALLITSDQVRRSASAFSGFAFVYPCGFFTPAVTIFN